MNKKPFLFFLVIFISGTLFAQNAQELRLGSFVSGHLNQNQEIWYSVRVTSTGILTVEITSNIDTYLEAYDSQRNLLKEDDDSGEGLNAKIDLMVTQGTYLFKLRGFHGEHIGPFRIIASHNPITITQLRSGSFVSGRINQGAETWYSFSATALGFLTVETSGDTDTYMEVYDPNFSFIIADDDGGEGLNAKIEIDVINGRTYYFKVRGYSSETNGPFRITANFTAYPPDERNTERVRAVPVRLGEVAYVYFRAPSESRWYIYESNRSNITLVVQTKGNLETHINFYDSNGRLLAEDVYSGEYPNALIRYRLNASGRYFIEIRENYGRAGRCTLHTEIWP